MNLDSHGGEMFMAQAPRDTGPRSGVPRLPVIRRGFPGCAAGRIPAAQPRALQQTGETVPDAVEEVLLGTAEGVLDTPQVASRTAYVGDVLPDVLFERRTPALLERKPRNHFQRSQRKAVQCQRLGQTKARWSVSRPGSASSLLGDLIVSEAPHKLST